MGGGLRGNRQDHFDDGQMYHQSLYEQSTFLSFPKREAESQMKHRDDAESLINQEIEGTVTINYGGSVSKHTYVEGVSDVDCRVYVEGTSLENRNPEAVKKYIAHQLSNDRSVKSIEVGRLGVTVTYRDGTEMQYIPAIKTRRGYRLQLGNHWSHVIYEGRFKRELKMVNNRCGGKLYGLIRIIKREDSTHPKADKLSGYHVENIAMRVFKHAPASVCQSERSMLKYYYKHAPRHIQHRITDSTGQSKYVDKTKLGGPYSPKRLRICRRMYARLIELSGGS